MRGSWKTINTLCVSQNRGTFSGPNRGTCRGPNRGRVAGPAISCFKCFFQIFNFEVISCAIYIHIY